MKKFRAALGAAVLLAFLFAPAANAQQFQVGVGGGYFTLDGDDFEGVDAGFGFDVLGRYSVTPNVDLGVVVQRTTHGTDFTEENIGTWSVAGEARYRFTMANSAMQPFFGARAGWARWSISEAGIDVAASGWSFGALGGIAFAMSPVVDLEGSVGWHQLSFGDVEVDGTTEPDTDSSGSTLAVRFGVSFKFGGI